MNIKMMRQLDYWLGLPLCFLFSCLNFILKITNLVKKEENVPKRILFIKLSELGTIILAYPLLRSIKEEHPSADLFFVTFKKNKSIFSLLSGIIPDKNILVIREDHIWSFALDALRAIRKIGQERMDIIFDLEFFSRFTAIFTYLAKAGKRIGFYRYTFEGLYRGNLLTHKVQYNPLNHITKTYLSLAQVIRKGEKNTPELNVKVEGIEAAFPRYVSEKAVRERVQDNLKSLGIKNVSRLFLLNPGEGTLPLREWPSDNFIAISRRLLDEGNNYIIIIGAEGATKKAKLILKATNSIRCVSLVGQTDLEELLELFSIADVLISNDCGLAHLAMLTSIKKFIIFGPESPQVFAPLGNNSWIIYSNWPCSPCLSVLNNRNSACKDNMCLKVIKPEDVYELIKNSLITNQEITE